MAYFLVEEMPNIQMETDEYWEKIKEAQQEWEKQESYLGEEI
jgi:hypothetical protein